MVENNEVENKEKDKAFEIIENDFKLVFDGGVAFHLYFKAKSGKWKEYGYNISIERCIKIITYNRINKKLSTTNLKDFLYEYTNIYKEVSNLLKNV